MEKIQKGIYRYDGELDSASQTPLVLVHPWYREQDNEFKIFNKLSALVSSISGKSYLENMNKLLENSVNTPIILFEEDEKAKIKSSCKKIISLAGEKGLYIIPTTTANPNSSKTSNEAVLDFIGTFSNNVDLAGGYLSRSFGYPRGFVGCLGETYMNLKRNGFNLKFITNCCFTV